MTTDQRLVSQSAGCRDKGEILSIFSEFAFGDIQKSQRLWVVSKETGSTTKDLAKQLVEEYLPYEQGLSSVIGSLKQSSMKNDCGLLVGDRNFLYVFLPPGYFVYSLNVDKMKIREVGQGKFLSARARYRGLGQDHQIVMSTERFAIEPKRLVEALRSAGASDRKPIDEFFELTSVSGPVGILSLEGSRRCNARPKEITLAKVSSDRGQKRPINEDCGAVMSVGHNTPQTASRYVLTGVADGVGGLAAGEIASKIAISSAMSSLMTGVLNDGSDHSNTIVGAFDSGNEKILSVAGYMNKSLASTLSVTLTAEGSLYVGYAGDTRVYQTRPQNRSILRLSVDHRLEQEGPQSHVITRSLGSRDHTPDVSGPLPLDNGDMVLTCSDGLHDLVTDAEILDAVGIEKSPREVCSSLIALANSRGGKDNITVAVMRWKGHLDTLSN